MRFWPIFIGILLLVHLPMVILYGIQVWEFLRYYRSRTRWLARTTPTSSSNSPILPNSTDLQNVPSFPKTLHLQNAPNARTPHCLVIVPCCGDEPGLTSHLRSVMEQDYVNYRVRCVVATSSDLAIPHIQGCIDCYENMELIIAGSPELENGVPLEGYKIHNLLAATQTIPDDCEILAFFDSDIQLQPWTLRSLASRLPIEMDSSVPHERGIHWNDLIGVSTGYRWLIPTYHERGTAQLGSIMVAGINATVGMLFGKHTPTFVWGGAWAIPRTLFDQLEIRRRWRGQLSDDMVVRAALLESGWRAGFEPGAIGMGACDFTFFSGLRFLRRQYQFIRHMSPLWWWFAFLVLAIGQLAFWLPPIVWSIVGDNGLLWRWIGVLWGILIILKTVIALRIHLAQRNAIALLVEASSDETDILSKPNPDEITSAVCRRYDRHPTDISVFSRIFMWKGYNNDNVHISPMGIHGYGPLTGLIHLVAVLSAGIGRTLLWRGIRYRISAQSSHCPIRKRPSKR